MRITHLLLIISCFIISCNKKQAKEEYYKYTNNLISETSPYLLQHAHNPVDWNAWNEETLNKAKAQNKLIIISIGYSACHWCHVMEEESFEDEAVAKLMNDNFISIKVDREERPDIDQIYMNAVQLMTGKGGWPLNCIALPDGRPIFGGTYFTKKEWTKALTELADLYQNNPEKASEYADKLIKGIHEQQLITVNNKEANFKKLEIFTAVKSWQKDLDFRDGGLVGETKFPMPGSLHFLLRYGVQNKDKTIQKYVQTTLTKMADGGIYDAIGGGFARYSTDSKWHIPHFEKMLYDNAQLVSLYSDAYLVTKDELYKKTVHETLDFVERELMDSSGAFYSSVDADSKNKAGKLEEGAYYVWSKEELHSILKSDYALFEKYFNINENGLWENKNYVLFKNQSDKDFALKNKLSLKELESKVKNCKQLLLTARNKRPLPHLDNKTLTSWNALMIKAYVSAYRVFRNPHYKEIALKNASFIVNSQLKKDGSLYHSYKDGKSTIAGFSEDYAAVTDAFIGVYQITLDENWLRKAKQLTDYAMKHFWDKKTNMFYFTSDTSENLITRKMEIADNVIPGSNSMMAHNLFQLGHYYSNNEYAKTAENMLNNVSEEALQSPAEYYNWLNLMLNYTDNYFEVALSGKEAIGKTTQFYGYYLPNILLAGATSESNLPILKNRFVDNETYIYVCVNKACKKPERDVVTAVEKIKNSL
ncbi:thioredoxin domain-containing protein [Flavobacterium cheongpyeongense]|uniref:Thioredoxin domain-containing protein n=1 Tax=Flavobacterium cheongpyeongense TaxID=2212651 RepID=A0A2V4BL98_9FLAO|nr:thioredoxin domain-containing protein [Flavobacterium cheongpyeongense]PXY39739.1 thioredoxin domain-containing protein [Flavobacterium cheongpyeongense]